MRASTGEGFFGSYFYVRRKRPRRNKREPCPTSPNIMPNKNGNVDIAKNAGLISLYRGIP